MRLFVFSLLVTLSAPSWAYENFRPFTRNENLAEQVQGDPGRVLPSSDLYTLAADFRVWKYWPTQSDYYHGPGYWADVFIEARPESNLTLNGQLSFLNGSSSDGYLSSQRILNLLGVTWYPDFWGEQKIWRLRFFDLGRQTLGAGLLVQDLEMSGLEISFAWDDNFVRLMFPGTAVLRVDGDLMALEAEKRWADSRLGLSLFFINDLKREENYDPTLGAWSYSTALWGPQGSLYFSQDYGLIDMDLEAGWRNNGVAGKWRLAAEWKGETWFLKPQLQARGYSEKYLENLMGAAQADFTPVNLVDRLYDNPLNFLRYPLARGPVSVYSGQLAGRTWMNDRHKLELQLEGGQFQYHGRNPAENYTWAKASWGFCPAARSRENCVSAYATNFALRAQGPNETTPATTPLRKKHESFGLEALFSL
ncbi:MAG: hypothetical protein KF802_12735 [Bdellovibrionaceae bacterium]|nr:hypothetical protein [Pseudobdellovibrionaceae bacterium]